MVILEWETSVKSLSLVRYRNALKTAGLKKGVFLSTSTTEPRVGVGGRNV